MERILPRCPCCEREGRPILVFEEGFYFIECAQCSDEVVFCQTEEEAMAVYAAKCSIEEES